MVLNVVANHVPQLSPSTKIQSVVRPEVVVGKRQSGLMEKINLPTQFKNMKIFIKCLIGVFTFSSIVASANNKNNIEALDELIKCSALSYIGTAIYIPPEFKEKTKNFDKDHKKILKENSSSFKLASDASQKNAELFKEYFNILNHNTYDINFNDRLHQHLVRYKNLVVADINNSSLLAEEHVRCMSHSKSVAKLKNSPHDYGWKKHVLSEIHKTLTKKYTYTEDHDGMFAMAAVHWGHFGYVTKRDVDRALWQSK